jgi:hypothetical protein
MTRFSFPCHGMTAFRNCLLALFLLAALAFAGEAPGSARYADIDAQYEGSYWLISEPGELTVRKGWFDEPQEIIVTYKMPSPDIRAVGKMEF